MNVGLLLRLDSGGGTNDVVDSGVTGSRSVCEYGVMGGAVAAAEADDGGSCGLDVLLVARCIVVDGGVLLLLVVLEGSRPTPSPPTRPKRERRREGGGGGGGQRQRVNVAFAKGDKPSGNHDFKKCGPLGDMSTAEERRAQIEAMTRALMSGQFGAGGVDPLYFGQQSTTTSKSAP